MTQSFLNVHYPHVTTIFGPVYGQTEQCECVIKTSLVFDYLTLISVVQGSNPGYDNYLDGMQACPYMAFADDRDVKPPNIDL